MWQFIIHSPEKEPRLVELKPGKLTLGRAETNDIVVDDSSASRQHAEVVFDSGNNTIFLVDLNSTNGTYVNHQRVSGTFSLSPDDLVRIGQFELQLLQDNEEISVLSQAAGTHPFTRELLLESLDKHSVLVYEVSNKLNTVMNLETALETIIDLIKQSMGVDFCQVILTARLHEMRTADFIDPLAKKAAFTGSAEVTPTSMFIPIMSSEEMLGLICISKTRTNTRHFDNRDLHVAVAISHQAALTIQRMNLLERGRREEQAQRLLLRFVSPAETEFLLKDYFENGELPGLKEQKVTVLFSDVANSTGLAENLGTEHFARILNGFYHVATQIIFKHNGMVKYLGDGILAIFAEQMGGMPTEEKAVLAGRELVSILHRTGSLDAKQRIVIGVAINTGPAMVGYIGTKERAEFSAMGDTVNVAYRMQEYARPYKIIVGPATVAAISDKYQFERVGAVSLRGREQSIQVYEVLP